MHTQDRSAGPNGHATGIILKELVRRAMVTIRNERQAFDVTQKLGYSGAMDDLFTSADRKAQDVYIRSLRECFPDHGILAEEDALSHPPSNGVTAYFTVDPLDGTKAFVRRQSQGVGTMIALVDAGQIVSAYIGDINTLEIYGYRPGSTKVHRISEFETAEELGHADKPLAEQHILLRDPEHRYTAPLRPLLKRFRSWEIEGGSIGTWMARLWKREVGAVLLPATSETPWDSSPVQGINQMLGYVSLRFEEGRWRQFETPPPTAVIRRDHDVLIVHAEDLGKLEG
jgi:fructose-1,6-bisphosphatase/inositol monophosphatase family enzyme